MGMTLDQWITEYDRIRAADRRSDGTRKLDRQSLGRLSRFIGRTVQLSALRSATLDDWRLSLRSEGLSDFTVFGHFKRVAASLERARRRELIAANPADAVSNPVPAETSGNPFVPPEQIEEIVAACPPPLAALVALCGFAGLRLDEAHRVTWGDVLASPEPSTMGRIRVIPPGGEVTTKRSFREPPIVPELEAFLERLGPGRLDHEVAYGPPKNPQRSLARAMASAGMEKLPRPFDTLRYSCVTRLIELDLHPVETVNKWVGHSRAVYGKHYHAVRPESYSAASPRARLEQEITELQARLGRETA